MRFLVLTKRQYTNKDLLDDKYGRIWELTYNMANQGHQVLGICLSYQHRQSNEYHELFPSGGELTWKSLNSSRLIPIAFAKYYRHCAKFAAEFRPDAIWSFSDSIYAILGQSLSTKLNAVSIVDLYDNFEAFGLYKIPGVGRLYRRAVVTADYVTCVGQNLYQHVRSEYGRTKPTLVLTNGVDTTLFRKHDKKTSRNRLGLPQDRKLVGAAGSLTAKRGALLLIEAMQGTKEPCLVFAGPRNRSDTIPTSDSIIDLGVLPYEEIPPFLSAMDVSVIFNKDTTFGNYCFPQKFFEALSCETPIVAADIGELSLILRDNTNILYDPANVASLRNAVFRQLEAMENPDITVKTWKMLSVEFSSFISRESFH